MTQRESELLHKQLVSLIVAPIAFQYLMASLVTASDAFMLGFLDQDSLSASSLAGQIAFVFSLFYGAFVFGLTVLAAQYWGKGDKDTAREVLAITMRYSLLVGLVFTLGTAIFPEQIMHFFTADNNLITAGGAYPRYDIIRLFLANCAFMEKYTVKALNECIKAEGKEPLISKKRAGGNE